MLDIKSSLGSTTSSEKDRNPSNNNNNNNNNNKNNNNNNNNDNKTNFSKEQSLAQFPPIPSDIQSVEWSNEDTGQSQLAPSPLSSSPPSLPATTTTSTTTPSVDSVCQAILDNKSDVEVITLLKRLDPSQINECNRNQQTIFYVACRYGKVEIVKYLLIMKGIRVNGPQDGRAGSTPLHGANWGGHLEIIAILLTLGVVPEKNNCGRLPSEEYNNSLPDQIKKQLQLLWLEYAEIPTGGILSIYKYLPKDWNPPNVQGDNFSSHKVEIITDKSRRTSRSKQNSMHLTDSLTFLPSPSSSGEDSMATPPFSTSSSSSFIITSQNKIGSSSGGPSSSTNNNTVVSTESDSSPCNSLHNISITSSCSSNLFSTTATSASSSSSNFQSLLSSDAPKNGPLYKRFTNIFFWKDSKGETHLYDLETTTKLNNAFNRNQTNVVITTTIKGKRYNLYLNKMYHECIDSKKGGPPKQRYFEMSPRIPIWYWRDDDGTIKAYDEKTNFEIAKAMKLGLNSLRMDIGKWTYDILIDVKIQRNIKSEHERPIWTEEDLARLQKWWQPHIPLHFNSSTTTATATPSTKKAELVPVPQGSDEWNRVTNFFYLTMPSKVRNSVIDRASGKSGKFKDCHSVIKIEKIVNPTLREHWEHELEMVKKNNNNDPNVEYVKLLFHGTSKTPPKIIYEADKGWKISYSRDDSLWGRGLYFALDSIYTHNYTYKTKDNSRQVFLAEVIVGDGIHCDENKALREPPEKDFLFLSSSSPSTPPSPLSPTTSLPSSSSASSLPSSSVISSASTSSVLSSPSFSSSLSSIGGGGVSLRYDSVIGQRHDSWIWISYDDARAYPTYLIEYQS